MQTAAAAAALSTAPTAQGRPLVLPLGAHNKILVLDLPGKFDLHVSLVQKGDMQHEPQLEASFCDISGSRPIDSASDSSGTSSSSTRDTARESPKTLEAASVSSAVQPSHLTEQPSMSQSGVEPAQPVQQAASKSKVWRPPIRKRVQQAAPSVLQQQQPGADATAVQPLPPLPSAAAAPVIRRFVAEANGFDRPADLTGGDSQAASPTAAAASSAAADSKASEQPETHPSGHNSNKRKPAAATVQPPPISVAATDDKPVSAGLKPPATGRLPTGFKLPDTASPVLMEQALIELLSELLGSMLQQEYFEYVDQLQDLFLLVYKDVDADKVPARVESQYYYVRMAVAAGDMSWAMRSFERLLAVWVQFA